MVPKYCVWDVGKTIYDYSLKPLDALFREKTSDIAEYEAKSGIYSYDYDPYMKGHVDFTGFCQDLCKVYDVAYSSYLQMLINKKLHEGVGEYFAETRQAMEMLKASGVNNCILSNALPILSHTSRTDGLVEPEHIFASYNIGLLKPDAAIFEHVKKSLGCEFGEIMFIDDKPNNVKAATSLGIRGIVYNRENVIKNLQSATNPSIFVKEKVNAF